MSTSLIIDPREERVRLARKGRAAIARDAMRERMAARKERQNAALHGSRDASIASRVKNFPYQILAAGRRIGKPAGSYMADLVSMRQTVLLCNEHKPKFNARANHYFYEKNLRVGGVCDDCRQPFQSGHLFVHESYIGHGGTWVPR